MQHFLFSSEIAIGGLFPRLNNKNSVVPSNTYFQDKLTWCIQRSKKIPIYVNIFFIIPLDIWLFFLFVSCWICSLLVYLLVPFDPHYQIHYKRVDYLYALLLVIIPAYAATSSTFQPKNTRLRLVYWILLTCPMFFQFMIGAYLYQFMKYQFYYHQIASVDEIIKNQFRLCGSPEVLNTIKHNPVVRKCQKKL